VTLVCDGNSSRFFIIRSDLYLGRGNTLLYVWQQFNASYSIMIKSFCIGAFGYQKKKKAYSDSDFNMYLCPVDQLRKRQRKKGILLRMEKWIIRSLLLFCFFKAKYIYLKG